MEDISDGSVNETISENPSNISVEDIFTPDGLNETISENTSDVSNISSIEELWLPFSNRGLHFLHININSLLSKIDEVREIAKKSRAVVLGISESKLDKSVLDGEVFIDGYEVIRSDRNRIRHGLQCWERFFCRH